jgi:hypothetical protein
MTIFIIGVLALALALVAAVRAADSLRGLLKEYRQ